MNIRWTLVHFWKSHVRANESDAQATSVSLDAGFRMDGIPALDLWDLLIEVHRSVPNRTDGQKREPWWNSSAVAKPNMHNPKIKHTNVIPTTIDHIPSKTMHSCAMPCCMCFEVDEAVIKKLSKEDPEILIKYTDTKNQLADILTKGNFTRDEWNHLVCLFNISHFSSLCCAKNLSLLSCITDRKNNQKRTRLWLNPGQWWWTWPVVLLQVLQRWTVRLRREARWYWKPQVVRMDYQGDLKQSQIKIPIPTERRVLKVEEMLNRSSAQGTCGNEQRSEVSESAGEICHQHMEICGNWIPTMSRKCRSSRRFRRFWTRSQIWLHHYRKTPDSVLHMEKSARL